MVIRTRGGKASAKAKAKVEAVVGQSDKGARNQDAVAPGAAKRDVAPLISRALNTNSKLEPEDIIELIYWIRQIQAIFAGCFYGFCQVTGSIGITSFILFALVGPTALIKRMHAFDEDDVRKIGSVSTEGMLPAFALFILSWIISYTTFLPPLST